MSNYFEKLEKMYGADAVDKIAAISNGNPGVMSMLIEIHKVKPNLLNPLNVMMDLTRSDSSLLWIVYKDICNHDADKTITYLKEWCNTTENLNDHIKKHNPEARHF